MLAHRLRRRTNIDPTMDQRIVFAGTTLTVSLEGKVYRVHQTYREGNQKQVDIV